MAYDSVPKQAPPQPVVVTFEQVSKALGTTEAVGQLNEAANQDADISPVQKAAILAGLGNVLDQLRRAEESAGAKVLTTPNDARAARLQSLIASGQAAKLGLVPLPSGGQEAIFDTQDYFGWARVAWEKLKHLRPHAMLRPTAVLAEPFPDNARVAVLGDWGTGLYGAPKIGKAVLDDPDPFAMLLHLGDVYYSGTDEEIAARFLGLWPKRADALSRALNSNHEMFSGGDAYFGRTLPTFGQEGSYFAYQNANWTLIGLDVAYEDHEIDDEQAWWVSEIVKKAGSRKIVLFSHHQLYSSLDSEQGTKLWSHPRFGGLLRSRRIFAWYWGHEHRCTIFGTPDATFGILGRCIGHSGMPQSRKATIGLARAEGKAFERADWRTCPARTVEGNPLPQAVVLEGPNEYIIGEESKFTPHGYAVLAFDGAHLTEEVRSADGNTIYSQQIA
jgi:Calcineurin-like phosphoesterase